jgi:PPOX class probable F420-dependent enzyme
MKTLPDSVKRLIEGRVFANVATVMPDGTPQVTQTWVDHEGDLVIINTFEGSQKSRNVRRNTNVALTISDPTNPFNIATIRGRVNEVTFSGAEAHVDRMSKKYLGTDKYPGRIPGMKRVLIKIEARSIIPPGVDTRPRPGQTALAS